MEERMLRKEDTGPEDRELFYTGITSSVIPREAKRLRNLLDCGA
jgi:hypothetical protein